MCNVKFRKRYNGRHLIILLLFVYQEVIGASREDYELMAEKNNRNGRFLKVVTILPTLCNGADSELGVCKTTNGCTKVNGTDLGGKCGTYNVGVCCLPIFMPRVNEVPVTVEERVATIKGNTNFVDNFFNFPKINGSCQLKLDFKSFSFMPPTNGVCNQDSFSVTGSTTVRSLTLCGPITRSLYLSYGNSDSIKLMFHSESRTQFEVKVQHIDCNSIEKVDDHCLLSYTGNSGTVQSFGYGPTGYQITGLEYNVCVGSKSGTPLLTWEMCVDDPKDPLLPGNTNSFYTTTIFGNFGGLHQACTGKTSYVAIPGVGTYCGGYFQKIIGAPSNLLMVKTVKDDYKTNYPTVVNDFYEIIISPTVMSTLTCNGGPGMASVFMGCEILATTGLKCGCKATKELIDLEPEYPYRPVPIGFCLMYSAS